LSVVAGHEHIGQAAIRVDAEDEMGFAGVYGRKGERGGKPRLDSLLNADRGIDGRQGTRSGREETSKQAGELMTTGV